MSHPPGIYKTPLGWRAFKRVGGKLYSKRFPPSTPLEKMKLWRKGREVSVKTHTVIAALDAAKEPTLDDDAETYLAAVQSMPSYSDRAFHIREWVRHFTGRTRNSITPLEIRTRLEQLIAAGYAANSANNRRVALMHFYAVLNGRSGYNPVRDVPRYRLDAGAPRGRPFGLVYRILACMEPSKSRARLRVMLWTGFPHKQIAQLKPEHVDLKQARVYVTPRRKGRGVPGRWLPLLPGAVVALREFHQWDAYGRFSNSAMHSTFARAIDRLNAHRAKLDQPPIAMRPYDLRHCFGTMLAEQIHDDRVVQELMLHSDVRMTRRYTEAATAGRLRDALRALTRPQ